MNPSDHDSLRILNASFIDEEWCSILPDSWSCSDRNTCGIISDYEDNSLSCKSHSSSSHSHIQQQAALLVANKPISIDTLSRISSKYYNQDGNFNLNVYEQRDAPSVYPNIYSTGNYTKPSRHRRVKSKERINENQDPKNKTNKTTNVYYFEVAVDSGNAWIGFVPAESFMSEQMNLTGDDRSSHKKNSYPVLVSQMPENIFSIGLAPDGRLLAQGTNVKRNSLTSSHSLTSENWTDPIKDGDVIGCGLELEGSYRVFFTKNGKILYPFVNNGFFNSGTVLFPSVGISTDDSKIYGNFGRNSHVPFCWKDSENLKQKSVENEAYRSFAPPTRNVLTKSPSTEKKTSNGEPLSKEDIESATEVAKHLENAIQKPGFDRSFVDSLVQFCQQYQEQVRKALENDNEYVQDYNVLLSLNDYLNQVLKSTTPLLNKEKEPEPIVQAIVVGPNKEVERSKSENNCFCLKMNQYSPEVDELVTENGIFGLICLLRGKDENRFEAAWALMRYAKDKKSLKLLGEIKSSGGMHSLLTLFKSRTSSRNLKLVAALAVSYLFPSFTDPAGLTVGHLGLRIAECLRYILNATELSDDSELSRIDIVQSATLAVTHLWINLLEPFLSGSPALAFTGQKDISIHRDTLGSLQHITSYFTKRSEQRNGPLEIQELLETTISLIVNIAEIIMTEGFSKGNSQNMNIDPTLRNNAACVIESICTVEHARPIAVRAGLLRVLVQWMDSNNIDLQRPAANALRDLTKPNDVYIAGWIHSQIVNEGALGSIVQLSASNALDVRYSVAQILYRLTIAPHTRAAIVDAKGIKYLVQLLVNSSEHSVEHKKIFLAAGRSLLQLGANAIKYSRGWTPDDIDAVVSLHRRDDVINDIIKFGAIEPFISMAKSEERGKLRLLSVEALCVLSDDENTGRMTRQKLCEAGIATAFGNVLRQDVRFLYEIIQKMILYDCEISDEESDPNELIDEEILLELYQSLRSFGNILEPVYSEDEKWLYEYEPNSTVIADHRSMLKTVCFQSAKSGGLDSILLIASLPIFGCSLKEETIVYLKELVAESCRSIASICPHLLSISQSHKGFGKICVNAMFVLAGILRNVGMIDELKEGDTLRDILLDVLRGITTLADCEPLKTRIIDLCLPQLLQLNQIRGEGESVQIVQASNQVCTALGFTEDEMDVKLAGNEPKLLADWFCLERSMLLQAMARDEVKYVLHQIWKPVFVQMDKQEVKTLIRRTWENSDLKWLVDLSESIESDLNSSKHLDLTEMKSVDFLKQIFRNIGCDDDTIKPRNKLLEQYRNIYDIPSSIETDRELEKSPQFISADKCKCSNNNDLTTPHTCYLHPNNNIEIQHELWEMLRHPWNDSDVNGSELLSSYCFKKIGNISETQWLLRYQSSRRNSIQNSEKLCSLVEDLLKIYFPSKLLQREVLPLTDINLKSCFDFRALQMPMRRYFSFRREGQVISRICEKYASSIESEGVYWTLGFENSSFAGEFAETLVQTLYRCPIIRALSFSRTEMSRRRNSLSCEDDDIGSMVLVSLAGSLPPWVSWLTFDNVLSKTALAALVRMFDTTEHSRSKSSSRSKGRLRKKIGAEIFVDDNASDKSIHGQCNWTFRGLVIKDSPQLGPSSFYPFFSLLSSNVNTITGVKSSPLSCLHSLDLSGNMLGDECIANLLEIIYSENSECSIESVDVSSNNIGNGTKVVEVFRHYYESRSFELDDSRFHVSNKRNAREASLRKIYLSSNSLRSSVICEIIKMLENNALNLQTLDLSDNNIVDDNNLLHSITSSIFKNTDLLELNLSRNQFSHTFMNEFVRIIKPKFISSNLAFIKFDYNIPPLTDTLSKDLSQLSLIGRMNRLRHMLQETVGDKPDISNIPDSNHLHDVDENTKSEVAQPINQQNMDLSDHSITIEPDSIPSSFESQNVTKSSSVREKDHPLHPSKDTANKKSMGSGNTIKVLTSAPLVWRDAQTGELNPIEVLDFELERGLLYQCLKEASHDIDITFDNATTQRLQSIVTKSCSCLHFSGHGHPNYLTFEDGRGGLHCLGVDQLKNLLSMGVRGGGAPFKFVFVSACYSGLAGETFVNAGVPHVVCCQQESQLMDSAALVFTRQFYLALAIGRTVKDSFEIGRQAVEVAAQVPNPTEEMKKFVLLPRDGDHDVPVFNAEKIDTWPKLTSEQSSNGSRRSGSILRGRGVREFENVSGESALQDINLPTPPQTFLGREIDMYKVLNAILDKRFVNIIGPKGMGRSSLTAALCQYINQRKSTFIQMEYIFYVSVNRIRGTNRALSFIDTLHDQLVLIQKATHPSSNFQFDKMSSIFNALRPLKALVVFEELDALDGPDKAQDFPLFLSSLFRETKSIRVLTTSRQALGLSSFGGVVEWQYKLTPLNFKNTVRLFANQSPFIHTGEERRRFLENMVTCDEQGEMCDHYIGIDERTKLLLNKLGGGIPSRIFDAANNMKKNEFETLCLFFNDSTK